MLKLPSKKVLSVLILATAAVTAIILAFGREKTGAVVEYANNLVAGEKMEIPENTGWRDELGEVSASADLSGAGPGENEDKTVTEAVSTSLFSNYLALKQSGALNQDSAQELIDLTIDYVEESGQVAEITRLHLNVVPDNGDVSITQYGENLGGALRGKHTKDLASEAQVVAAVAATGDLAETAKLESISKSYEEITRNLLVIPVPETFTKAHLDIVNGTNGIAVSLKQLQNLSTDPFKGVAALQLYQTSVTRVLQATTATIKFISSRNIVYKQGSGGYYLLYGI